MTCVIDGLPWAFENSGILFQGNKQNCSIILKEQGLSPLVMATETFNLRMQELIFKKEQERSRRNYLNTYRSKLCWVHNF